MMDKKTIAVLFGGQSSEHEVSCRSALTVIQAIDKSKYELMLVGITKEGHWLYVDSAEAVADGTWKNSSVEAMISPDAKSKCMVLFDGADVIRKPVDLVFPVLHGLYGEDGTVQGILELARIPYVGCGVLASAVSMDKLYTKLIVDRLGIRQASYVPVMKKQLHDMEAVCSQVEEELGYPVFVKPSNAGSSCGVSKASDREELKAALKEASRHDRKILVEEAIVGREVECAVYSAGESRASGIGEILAGAEFYDYDAKYNSPQSQTVIDPEFPQETVEEVRKDAVKIFDAVDGYGLARVDFFVETKTGEVVFNEINTMPGFTSISMYPMLWGAKGIDKPELVEMLIQSGFSRYLD